MVLIDLWRGVVVPPLLHPLWVVRSFVCLFVDLMVDVENIIVVSKIHY